MLVAIAAAVTVLSGGTDHPWTLTARHQKVQGFKAVCLRFDIEGTGGGRACLAGTDPLKSYGNVLQFGARSQTGETTTADAIGGMTTGRARSIKAKFDDGTVVEMPAQHVAAWPKAFGRPVRWFGGDVLAQTGANLVRVSAYDAKGRRVGRFKVPKVR